MGAKYESFRSLVMEIWKISACKYSRERMGRSIEGWIASMGDAADFQCKETKFFGARL